MSSACFSMSHGCCKSSMCATKEIGPKSDPCGLLPFKHEFFSFWGRRPPDSRSRVCSGPHLGTLYTFIHHEGSTKQRKRNTQSSEKTETDERTDKTQDKLSKQTTHIKPYHRNYYKLSKHQQRHLYRVST